MADYSDPKRATAYRFTLSLFARSDNQIKVTPTLAAGDVKVSKDNGATANITTLPAETPASSGILQVDLSATEMTADLVTIIFRDAAGAEWNDVAVNIAPSTVQMADLSTKLDTIDDFLDTEIAAITTATTAASIRSAVGLASANLDTQIGDIPTNAELATSQAAADDATLAAIAALSIPTAAAVADAVWDEDATAHQTQGTFGQAIGDPAADADSIWALVNTNLDAAVSTRLPTSSYTSPLSSAGTRGALGMASANLDTQIATLATAAALAVVDDFLDTEVAAILAAVDTEIGTLQTSVNDLPTNAELATALAAADDAVLAAIAALNNLSAAQINAEVVDALATDTYAEPGQGAPGATVSLATKVNYLYAALRNKSTVTATEHRIFADDGSTVIVKRTLSDDATTFTSTELATGA